MKNNKYSDEVSQQTNWNGQTWGQLVANEVISKKQ